MIFGIFYDFSNVLIYFFGDPEDFDEADDLEEPLDCEELLELLLLPPDLFPVVEGHPPAFPCPDCPVLFPIIFVLFIDSQF